MRDTYFRNKEENLSIQAFIELNFGDTDQMFASSGRRPCTPVADFAAKNLLFPLERRRTLSVVQVVPVQARWVEEEVVRLAWVGVH